MSTSCCSAAFVSVPTAHASGSTNAVHGLPHLRWELGEACRVDQFATLSRHLAVRQEHPLLSLARPTSVGVAKRTTPFGPEASDHSSTVAASSEYVGTR